MIRAGQLRHQVTVEVSTETQNARGEAVQAWAAERTLWVRIEPLLGRELVLAQQRVEDVTHRITMRYRDEMGIATGAQSASTLQDTTKTWALNEFAASRVVIAGGTGAGQSRMIVSNTATTLAVMPNWTTPPDGTSTYQVRWLMPKKRINYQGRIFNIQEILNIDEKNRELQLLVVEVFSLT